jgi:hypothetical protein
MVRLANFGAVHAQDASLSTNRIKMMNVLFVVGTDFQVAIMGIV